MRKENLTTKQIEQFTTADTIYIKDSKAQPSPEILLCRFASYENGMVTGKVMKLATDQNLHTSFKAGDAIRVRLANCALWGTPAGRAHPHWHWFQPTGYAYTDRATQYAKEEQRIDHESFGVIRLSTGHGADKVLFGSSITHRTTITIHIDSASLTRKLHNDYIHGERELIEIEMSATQFADFFTSGGKGSGTPVTIRRFNGKTMERPPFQNKRAEFQNEFKGDMHNLALDLDALMEDTEKIMGKPNVTKGDREYLRDRFKMIRQAIDANIPFITDQFNKQVDRSVTEAKGEIEAFFDQKVRSLGLDALKDQVKQLVAPNVGIDDGKEGE